MDCCDNHFQKATLKAKFLILKSCCACLIRWAAYSGYLGFRRRDAAARAAALSPAQSEPG